LLLLTADNCQTGFWCHPERRRRFAAGAEGPLYLTTQLPSAFLIARDLSSPTDSCHHARSEGSASAFTDDRRLPTGFWCHPEHRRRFAAGVEGPLYLTTQLPSAFLIARDLSSATDSCHHERSEGSALAGTGSSFRVSRGKQGESIDPTTDPCQAVLCHRFEWPSHSVIGPTYKSRTTTANNFGVKITCQY